MPKFPWIEYLRLSQNIVQNIHVFNHKEAVHRCAISRAYYSAYCIARNYARDFLKFRPTRNRDDHTSVASHFKDKGMVNIGMKLLDLKGWREKCDYEDDEVRDITRLTINAQTLADYLIQEISKLPVK